MGTQRCQSRILSKFAGTINASKAEITFDLNFLSKQVNDAYERLRHIQTPDQDIVRKIDTCVVLTRSLQKRLESYLSSRESLNNDVNDDDRQSLRSKISRRSSISRHSIKSSILSVKRADAAADVAAKQIELDAFQAKAKHREETARLEAELARQKAQLEQMEINEQVQIANVYQEIDKEEQARFIENQPVAEDVDERNMNTRNSTRPISSPGPANPCLQPLSQSPHDYSSQQPNYDTGRINHDPPLPRKSLENSELYQKHLYQQPSNPRIESTPRSDNTAASAAAIAATITDSISMSRLPVPEPIIFKGEPIEYSEWKFSFYALVDHKCI